MNVDKKIYISCVRESFDMLFKMKNPTRAKEMSRYLNEKSDRDILNLMVTGEFNSGKATLTEDEAINAVFSYENNILNEIVTPSEREWINRLFAWLWYRKAELPSYNFNEYKEIYLKASKVASDAGATPDQIEKASKLRDRAYYFIQHNGDAEKLQRSMEFSKLKNIWDEVKDKAGQIQVSDFAAKFAKNTAISLAVIGAVSIILYIAYSIHQKYYSEAAKACKSKSGEQQEICVTQFRIKALERQKKEITAGFSVCKNTTDSEKCKKLLKQKINKLDMKISKLKKK